MLSDRILFIDDQPQARLDLIVSLDSFGLQMDVAGGIAAARKLAESHTYGVVAVSLEKGNDALEALEELQQLQPQATYALVGIEPDLVLRAVNDYGVGAILERPWQAAELACELRRCLETHVERYGHRAIDERVAGLHRGMRVQQNLLERSLEAVLDSRGGDGERSELMRSLRAAQEQLVGAARRFFLDLAELERSLEQEAGAQRRLQNVASHLERAARGQIEPLGAVVDGSDQREAERVPLVADVTLESSGAQQYGTTENVSIGGLFIATDAPYRAGERLSLSFTVPGSERIEVNAEVAWCRAPRHAGFGSLPAGVGVRFLDLTATHRGAIARFIDLWSNEGIARLERLAM